MDGEANCGKDFLLRTTLSEIKPHAILGDHVVSQCLAAYNSETIGFLGGQLYIVERNEPKNILTISMFQFLEILIT